MKPTILKKIIGDVPCQDDYQTRERNRKYKECIAKGIEPAPYKRIRIYKEQVKPTHVMMYYRYVMRNSGNTNSIVNRIMFFKIITRYFQYVTHHIITKGGIWTAPFNLFTLTIKRRHTKNYKVFSKRFQKYFVNFSGIIYFSKITFPKFVKNAKYYKFRFKGAYRQEIFHNIKNGLRY